MFPLTQEIQSNTAFHGVRFALFGFDPPKQDEVRSKLVSCGAVDAGQYGPNCTHVIVDKLIYDDPICAVARQDGKILVTSLWVRHSLDAGLPVDASPIMYRPVKELNGIPTAKDLVMCLTGYQRQDREDIMTMVSLMGAQFTKPLVANRVTHLICYKFEGEKYELAKRIKKIKLVNHRWLEDCLKAWEILLEDNYNKSGYELEMMEAEAAKDSEEETEDGDVKHSTGRNFNTSPLGLQNKLLGTHGSPMFGRRASHVNQAEGSTAVHINDVATSNDSRHDYALKSTHATPADQQAPGFQDAESTRDAKSSGLRNQNITVSSPKKDLLSSCSGSKRSPDSDGSKYNSLTYYKKTPRKSGLPLQPVETGSNVNGRLSEHRGEHVINNAVHVTPSKEHSIEKDSFVCPKTPLSGASLHDQRSNSLLCYKRKVDAHSDISPGSSKSQKLSSSPSNTMNAAEILTAIDGFNKSKPASIMHLSSHSKESATPKSMLDVSTDKSCSQKLEEIKDGVSMTLTSDALVVSKSKNEELRKSVGKLRASARDIISETSNLMSNTEKEAAQNQERTVDILSAENKLPEVTISSSSKLDLSVGAADKRISSSLKKSVGGKILGSRPSFKMGSSANQKGSICPSRTSPTIDTSVHPGSEIPTADPVKSSDANSPEMPAVRFSRSINQHNDDLRFGNNSDNIAKSMDDETEAPSELETVENNEKCEEGELPSDTELRQEIHDNVDKGDKNVSAKSISEENKEQGGSIPGADTREKNLTKRKKHVASKTRKKPYPTVLEVLEPKLTVSSEEDDKRNSKEEKKRVSNASVNYRGGTSSKSKTCPSVEGEKENEPVDNDQSMANVEKGIKRSTTKSAKTKVSSDLKKVTNVLEIKDGVHIAKEPAWFILSGHKLQRKEFQKIIRRLRGRLCRDCHQWSYQATHFIVPDPLRRTEKFFAAAASGSWILKTDYLTASDQAGKLLPEEPYEWHKNGLSEDGAISLEAPRKWRLLKERTGHGAFHKMRIVIYGDCIAPPLDTLKRVVKAGDGTILATSPPYTRFLNPGVDFAIVSPGMPRVDVWVQEFLKHKIPCVLADYLVEYVCKPGYPLDKHVQYNTHEWAAKSFANLLSRSKEVVLQDSDPFTSEEQVSNDDLSCQVCGSTDRGDVMLICGNESGSAGCGVGTHIDCCDPPLKEVPEGDWFCLECRDGADNNTTRIVKKRASKSKKR